MKCRNALMLLPTLSNLYGTQGRRIFFSCEKVPGIYTNAGCQAFLFFSLNSFFSYFFLFFSLNSYFSYFFQILRLSLGMGIQVSSMSVAWALCTYLLSCRSRVQGSNKLGGVSILDLFPNAECSREV